MDSFEKLSSSVFPTYEEFFSEVKNTNILRTDFDHAKSCFDENCETMADYLKYYNNLDVKPLRNRELFSRYELDLFKDALSIPAVSFQILFDDVARTVEKWSDGVEHPNPLDLHRAKQKRKGYVSVRVTSIKTWPVGWT